MIIKLRTISSNFQNEKFLLFTIFLVGTLFIYIYLWVDERPLPLSLAFIATLMFCFPVGYATLTPLRNYIENKPNIIKLNPISWYRVFIQFSLVVFRKSIYSRSSSHIFINFIFNCYHVIFYLSQ